MSHMIAVTALSHRCVTDWYFLKHHTHLFCSNIHHRLVPLLCSLPAKKVIWRLLKPLSIIKPMWIVKMRYVIGDNWLIFATYCPLYSFQKGQTPLHAASAMDHPALVELLVKFGALLDIQTKVRWFAVSLTVCIHLCSNDYASHKKN